MHDLVQVSWVGFMLNKSCPTSHTTAGQDLEDLDDLDRDLSVQCVKTPSCVVFRCLCRVVGRRRRAIQLTAAAMIQGQWRLFKVYRIHDTNLGMCVSDRR